jgi:hypothetical protein
MRKAWLVVLALLLVGVAQGGLSIVNSTSGSKSRTLEVHAGGLVVASDEPGAAFGTVRAGKGKRVLSYFVILRHNLEGSGESDFSEDTKASDDKGQSKQSIKIDGKKLEVAYTVTLDPASGVIRQETLALNGKAVSVARGRVFLVDLTVSPPKWEQKNLKLPAEVPALGQKKAASATAKKVLESLAKEDRKVAAFLKGKP